MREREANSGILFFDAVAVSHGRPRLASPQSWVRFTGIPKLLFGPMSWRYRRVPTASSRLRAPAVITRLQAAVLDGVATTALLDTRHPPATDWLGHYRLRLNRLRLRGGETGRPRPSAFRRLLWAKLFLDPDILVRVLHPQRVGGAWRVPAVLISSLLLIRCNTHPAFASRADPRASQASDLLLALVRAGVPRSGHGDVQYDRPRWQEKEAEGNRGNAAGGGGITQRRVLLLHAGRLGNVDDEA